MYNVCVIMCNSFVIKLCMYCNNYVIYCTYIVINLSWTPHFFVKVSLPRGTKIFLRKRGDEPIGWEYKNFFAQLGLVSQLVKHKPVQNYLHCPNIPDTVHTAAPAIQHKPQYPFSGHHVLCTGGNHTSARPRTHSRRH